MNTKINDITDLFRDPSIRAVGIVADPNQGKSNAIYHCIKALRGRAQIYQYGLKVQFDGIQAIHSIEELEKITNSVVFIDEFPTMFRLSNRRQVEHFEESMRKIYHSNNIMVICGLPHNFNKFLSGLLNAIIFKQCTLVDFIQRSPAERIINSYSSTGGSEVQKGSRVVTMPKDIALVFDGYHYHEVGVPYIKDCDTKLNNAPIIDWDAKIKAK